MENPQAYSLRIGTVKQRGSLGTPQREIWTRRRMPWVGLPEGVPSFDGQP